MDINCLSVFNSIYKLELSSTDFKEIKEEQEKKEHTGLAIVCVKNNKIIGVSHDQDHDIVIKKIKNNKFKIKPKTRILFKTLINFYKLPKQVYTLHEIGIYRALDTDIKSKVNSIEQLKDRICDRFIDEYPKTLGEGEKFYYDDDNYNRKKKARTQKQLNALFWLFGEEFKDESEVRNNVPTIIKVFQRKNRRLALIKVEEDYMEERGGCMNGGRYEERHKETIYRIKTFTPKNPEYNYVSPNREMYYNIWIDDSLLGKISYAELKILSGGDYANFELLTPDSYNSRKEGVRISLMNTKNEAEQEKAKSILTKAIEKQFKAGKVTRKGITFTKKSVEYEGIVVKGDDMAEYLEGQNIIIVEKPNFNEILNGYIDFILDLQVRNNYYMDTSEIVCNFNKPLKKLEIDKIKIVIVKRGNNVYLNTCKISKTDLRELLRRALQFKSQKEYDKLIAYTSRTNLRLQKALELGYLGFTIEFSRTDDSCLVNESTAMELSIPIKQEKGRNYVSIGDDWYKVKDTSALFNIGNKVDEYRIKGGLLQRTIKLLYRAVSDINPDKIGKLIQNGKKLYREMTKKIREEEKKKVERSIEFIKHAKKVTKATEVKIGNIKGYKVKGLSGTEYFIRKDLQVYTLKNGKPDKYLCIIDEEYGDESWKVNDQIAKRLLMLSQDKKVAKEIWENGDGMDTWWLELQEQQEKVIV